MYTALTRTPPRSLGRGELTYLGRVAVDYKKALKQHENYRRMIARCGVQVIVLNETPLLPDSVFVEDTALIFDEIAVLTSMGALSRREETRNIAPDIARYRTVSAISFPATIEGGDILEIGKKLFVGRSRRTNHQGIRALEKVLKPYEYQVIPVNMQRCLHLKSACTAIDDNTVLMNPEWADPEPFNEFKIIPVPDSEPHGGNILRINDTVCISESYPETITRVQSQGYAVKTVDNSEFIKCESGMTCMSLIFKTTPGSSG